MTTEACVPWSPCFPREATAARSLCTASRKLTATREMPVQQRRPNAAERMNTAIFEMDDQQGPTAQPRELCSVFRGSLDGRKFGGEWVHVYVWLSPFAVHLKLSQHC